MSKVHQADFNVDVAHEVAEYLAQHLKAPVVGTYISTLGGRENVSIMVKLSLDPKETWYNGIFENSRYMGFHISRKGTIEQFSGSHRFSKKFRKTHVSTPDQLVHKINAYLDSVR